MDMINKEDMKKVIDKWIAGGGGTPMLAAESAMKLAADGEAFLVGLEMLARFHIREVSEMLELRHFQMRFHRTMKALFKGKPLSTIIMEMGSRCPVALTQKNTMETDDFKQYVITRELYNEINNIEQDVEDTPAASAPVLGVN